MPYEKMKGEELILRDKLAVERTKLAEERTYLAYIRTGMTIMLGGFFFIGYFKEGFFSYVGYVTIAVASLFMIYGFYKHRKTRALVERITAGMNGIFGKKKG